MTAWTFVLGAVVVLLLGTIAALVLAIRDGNRRMAALEAGNAASEKARAETLALLTQVRGTVDTLRIAWKRTHGATGLGD